MIFKERKPSRDYSMLYAEECKKHEKTRHDLTMAIINLTGENKILKNEVDHLKDMIALYEMREKCLADGTISLETFKQNI